MKRVIKRILKNCTSLNISYIFKLKHDFLSVLKSSVVTFLALIILLIITKLPQSIFQRNHALNLDELDLAIAVMGFILIFLTKILEAMQRRN